MAQVTVIGAGIAGAACAAELTAAGLDVAVIERGRAPGGRMAAPVLHGRRVDLGAAYFTVRDPDFAFVVDGWRAAGLARPWSESFDVIGVDGPDAPSSGTPRWAAPDGLRALVRNLLADSPVTLERTVWSVGHDGQQPVVDGERTDAVALAMPDTQAARLVGDAISPDDGWRDYEPVIAVAAGWRDRTWTMADAGFVNDHPDVSLVVDDGSRRGDGAPVLVAHTTSHRAAMHLERPDAAVEPVLSALAELIGVTDEPLWTHAHRWTFAKPAGTHGDASCWLGGSMIGVAGDAWCPNGAPRVESAWLSGRSLGRAIARRQLTQ